MKEVLDELPYGPAPAYQIVINKHFRSSLDQAVQLYAAAREEALTSLYKTKDLNKSRPLELEADFEEVAASCGHFSFSLQNFANELNAYLDILEDLKIEMDERPNGRTWNWLKIWRKVRRTKRQDPRTDAGNIFSPLRLKASANYLLIIS